MPSIDEALGKREGHYRMTDATLDVLHETILAGLNCMSLSEAEQENGDAEKGTAYNQLAQKLMGICLQVAYTRTYFR